MSALAICNPANGARIADVLADDAASIARKAQRARAAQPAWARTPLAERIACIERFGERVVRDRLPLAEVMTRETGKPIRMSRDELDGLLGRLDFFTGMVGMVIAGETVYDESDLIERIEHMPLGVVAHISAWNYPWYVGCNAIVPALLTGNAVLYKPSEYATLTGLEIARLLHEAGVPQDVFLPVTGAGDAGAALLGQKLDGVFFTGSYATGTRIAQAAAARFLRLQLELGGKSPVYVCDDADVKAAAESLADGAMYNTGQSCGSVERIYVHGQVHDAFLAHFVAAVRRFKVGDPMREDTDIGPVTRAAQLDVLEAQVADARARGATLLAGGSRLGGPGHWFAPTVFSGVDHAMALMREESFGPIIGIQRVASDEQAVQLMNDTRYGLTAGVYTPQRERAERILAQVHAGSLYWNCCDRVSPRLPWSGCGDSGMGLTLSTYGIQAFTRPRAWHLKPRL